ncbi:MAG TPA: hypothetical protein DCM54_01260 [Gammaproteobacteria bacterium]|nr:hypothetical protein [Gammaproteobacteria bacterium]
MNQKVLIILGLIVVAMAALVALLSMDGTTEEEPTLLLPGLKQKLTDIDRVEIETASGSVTLTARDGDWLVDQKDNYRAKRKELSEMVSELASAKLEEKKTSRSENYPRLGVSSLDEEDSEATRVAFHAGEQVFTVWLGNSSQGRDGRFARIENQVWLTDEVSIEKDAAGWLEPVIIDVDAEEIARVELGTLVFERGEEGDFEFLQLPDDRELKYPSITNEPARALTTVRLEDVARHDPERWEGANQAKFFTKDQTQVSVQAIQRGEGNWLHFNVGESNVEESSVESESTRFASDLSAWDYRVSSYIYDDFVKSLDDLLAEEEEETEVE